MHSDGGLKILIISMLFPSSANAAKAPFVLRTVREMSKRAQVKVIAPVRYFPLEGVVRRLLGRQRLEDKVPYRETIDGIEVYHPRVFLPPLVLRSFHGLLYFAAIAPLVRRLRREFPFDVISAPYLYPDGFAGALAGRLVGTPAVLEALGCDVNLFFRYRIKRAFIRAACRAAARVIAVNRDLKVKLERIGIPGELVTVIANGVDVREFRVMDMQRCRALLGLPAERRIVLFIGNMEEVKGVEYLVEAWRTLAIDHGKRLLLVMVGGGDQQEKIARRVKRYGLEEYVHLVGPKPYNEIPFWMNAGEVLCLPSIREGSPNVLLEAVACGKYVVASRVGGIPEMLPGGSQGILVTPGDACALARALEEALSRPTGQHVGVVKSWEESAGERLTLFEAVVRARKGKMDEQQALPTTPAAKEAY
jgi:glycosyltransferase involved in cell wall biosynthesis